MHGIKTKLVYFEPGGLGKASKCAPEQAQRDDIRHPYLFLLGPTKIQRCVILAAVCGIYYLWDGAKVIYVGASRYIEGRMSQHRARGIDFAGYLDECARSELNEHEARAIKEFQPLLNACTNCLC